MCEGRGLRPVGVRSVCLMMCVVVSGQLTIETDAETGIARCAEDAAQTPIVDPVRNDYVMQKDGKCCQFDSGKHSTHP